MPNKMLIDASHPEETRVVVVRGSRIEEFDFESQDKKQLKGNIYLARVTRVEPSLQAAFVEYGGNRHGFLAFSEIHPDYYQIPVADRQALLRADAEAAEADEQEEDDERNGRGRNRRRRRGSKGRSREEGQNASAQQNGDDAPGDDAGEDHADDAADTEATGEVVAQADDDSSDPDVIAHDAEADVVSEPVAAGDDTHGKSDDSDGDHHDDAGDHGSDDHGDHDNGDHHDNGGESEVDTVGAEDAIEEARDRRRPVRRQYKIQEVIKRRQILLVQVVKEERGNKGAALTTYLSLAGRYSVLMPNTARGGGISRKITNAQDRKRLKDVVKDLEVPQGMGVILRTAGESRTKAEIKRDYEYLMRLWENVRSLTLQSVAPALVYEEGSLIKRSVRDLYNKDIDEILVAGDDGYREAKDFMRMLMPSHAKVVQPYRDNVPIFVRQGVEAQLDKMVQPQVTLKSGGYIIINQTEALVSIDVNSGRSTREHSIEDTALQTNLEAAEEVARQLRLRDLAGLIVIDFIDMEENRNNRAVEKRMKDCLKNDRARIQVGRISHFGLLEMSRQRIRASVLDSTMTPCPHCGGTGHVRSESSVALLVVRAIEEFLVKEHRYHISVRTPASTALYVLNHKRKNLSDLEARFGLNISIEPDDHVGAQHYAIAKGAIAEKAIAPETVSILPPEADEPIDAEIVEDSEIEEVEASESREQQRSQENGDQPRRKRRRRRRRGGGADRENGDAASTNERNYVAEAVGDLDEANADTTSDDEDESVAAEASEEAGTEDSGKRRRRGKRGGRRNRRDDTEVSAQAEIEGHVPHTPSESTPDLTGTEEPSGEVADAPVAEAVEAPSEPAVAEESAEAAVEEAPARKPARRSRKKDAAPAEVEAEAAAAPAKPARRSRKKVVEAAAPEPVAAKEAAPVTEATPAPAEVENEPVAAEQLAQAPAGPVVTSSTPVAEEEEQPRRTGWWQRKSFF